MNTKRRFVSAMAVSGLATLVFIAGQERFAYLDPQLAKYCGIGLTLVAGVLWAAFGLACGTNRSD